MGMSSYPRGPGRNSPLLPPWVDDIDDNDPVEPREPNQPDKKPSLDEDQGDGEQPDALPQEPRQPTIDYSPTRRQIRRYAAGGGVGSGGVRGLVGSYVKGSGGARNATRASVAGRRATAGIGSFARDVVTRGVERALERLDLGDIIGQSVNTVLSRVTDALLSNATNVYDREAARSATYNTLGAMYERYSQGGDDITALNAMNMEDVREFVTISVSNYIYERVMQVAEHTFEGDGLPQEQLFKMEQELRGFIQADVNREISGINITDFDWTSPESEQMAAQLYENAYKIWEALQE